MAALSAPTSQLRFSLEMYFQMVHDAILADVHVDLILSTRSL